MNIIHHTILIPRPMEIVVRFILLRKWSISPGSQCHETGRSIARATGPIKRGCSQPGISPRRWGRSRSRSSQGGGRRSRRRGAFNQLEV